MESDTINLSREQILKILEFWSDVGVIIIDVTNNEKIYPGGTLKYIYDKETDIINIKGLSNQDMNYIGTLSDFLKGHTFYVTKSQEIDKRSNYTNTRKTW